jgi:hypothetical protein
MNNPYRTSLSRGKHKLCKNLLKLFIEDLNIFQLVFVKIILRQYQRLNLIFKCLEYLKMHLPTGTVQTFCLTLPVIRRF